MHTGVVSLRELDVDFKPKSWLFGTDARGAPINWHMEIFDPDLALRLQWAEKPR